MNTINPVNNMSFKANLTITPGTREKVVQTLKNMKTPLASPLNYEKIETGVAERTKDINAHVFLKSTDGIFLAGSRFDDYGMKFNLKDISNEETFIDRVVNYIKFNKIERELSDAYTKDEEMNISGYINKLKQIAGDDENLMVRVKNILDYIRFGY